MQTINVENIKCGGCMNTIKNVLSKLDGVNTVNIDENKETITYEGTAQRASVIEKLAEIGYPEVGNNNLKHRAVSFVSCAVGRLSK
jgi:copper chaperone